MPDIYQSAGSNRTIRFREMLDGDRPYQAEVVYGAGTGGSGSTALPAGTDRSGSIAAGSTAQQLAPAKSDRVSLTGQNISSADLWINEIGGTAAVNGTGSYKIAAGQAFAIGTNRAISIIGATTGQQFTATET